MNRLIRFHTVEIVSTVCFRNGKEPCRSYQVISLLLVPDKMVKVLISPELMLPEIFLQ